MDSCTSKDDYISEVLKLTEEVHADLPTIIEALRLDQDVVAHSTKLLDAFENLQQVIGRGLSGQEKHVRDRVAGLLADVLEIKQVVRALGDGTATKTDFAVRLLNNLEKTLKTFDRKFIETKTPSSSYLDDSD